MTEETDGILDMHRKRLLIQAASFLILYLTNEIIVIS